MAVPQVRVSAAAAKRIIHHDCWVFRDELLTREVLAGNGESVELIDPTGRFLAHAFYNAHSHIAARVISRQRDQSIDRALIAQRIEHAIAQRQPITGTTGRRLVFSEADQLPGLIVDQYADVVVLQSRTAGIERWKSAVVDALQALLHPAGILERSDKEFRDEEGLPVLTQVLAGHVPERILIEEDGLRFLVDLVHGHKTGFYLDQRDTRRLVRRAVRPGHRVLDAFAYTGAFGIAAAASGAQVVCVEQHEPLIALAKENAALNGVESRMEFVAGDAFYWLGAKTDTRDRFDWVLLDPPALAKSKADVAKGRESLHRVTMHGLALLPPGGIVALSVCTYHLLGLAEEILRMAAERRGLRLRMRGVSLQAGDHPWILQIPATRYLMTWFAQHDGPPAA